MEGQFRMHQNRFFLEVSQLTFFPNVTCRHDYFHQIWSRKVFSEPKNVIFWYFQVMLEKVMLEKSHVGKTQNRFFPFCDFEFFQHAQFSNMHKIFQHAPKIFQHDFPTWPHPSWARIQVSIFAFIDIGISPQMSFPSPLYLSWYKVVR